MCSCCKKMYINQCVGFQFFSVLRFMVKYFGKSLLFCSAFSEDMSDQTDRHDCFGNSVLTVFYNMETVTFCCAENKNQQKINIHVQFILHYFNKCLCLPSFATYLFFVYVANNWLLKNHDIWIWDLQTFLTSACLTIKPHWIQESKSKECVSLNTQAFNMIQVYMANHSLHRGG